MTDPIVPQGRGGSPSTSMSLLRLALAEDPEAWEQIVFLYSPLVYSWCRAKQVKEGDIPDLGQDVFLTLFRKLGQFRKDDPRHSFRKWLKTMTNRKVIDYFRKKTSIPGSLGAIDPDEISDEEAESGEDAQTELMVVVRQCLEIVRSEFEPRSFDAFWATVVDGRSAADVGQSLSMTTGAVFTAKSRISRRLRALLEGLEDDLLEP